MRPNDVTEAHMSSDTAAAGAATDEVGEDGSGSSEWRRRCAAMMMLCRRTRRHVRCSSVQRRLSVGVVLMCIGAAAFVSLTRSLVSLTASSHFNAPLFTVNVATLPTNFLYPLHVAYRYTIQHGKLSIRDAFRYLSSAATPTETSANWNDFLHF